MDTSLPWLRGRAPLSSHQRETGKCFGGGEEGSAVCLLVCFVLYVVVGFFNFFFHLAVYGWKRCG